MAKCSPAPTGSSKTASNRTPSWFAPALGGTLDRGSGGDLVPGGRCAEICAIRTLLRPWCFLEFVLSIPANGGDRLRADSRSVVVGPRQSPAFSVNRHLFGRRVDVVVARRAAARSARRAAAGHPQPHDREPPDREPLQDAAHDRPGGRDQQDQAEDVGDESGSQEQGAANDDQEAVDHLLAGEAALRERLVEAAPGTATLVFEQEGAEQGVGQEQAQGRPEADRFADLDDHVELRDRDDDEEDDQEKGHIYSLGTWNRELVIYAPRRRE